MSITQTIAGVMSQARATGLFVSTATFKQKSGTISDSGQPSTTYTAITALSNIACMLASYGSPDKSDEAKSVQETLALQPRKLLLDDYYGDVPVTLATDGVTVVYGPQAQFLVTVDGVDYDILGVGAGSQHHATRLHVRKAQL